MVRLSLRNLARQARVMKSINKTFGAIFACGLWLNEDATELKYRGPFLALTGNW